MIKYGRLLTSSFLLLCLIVNINLSAQKNDSFEGRKDVTGENDQYLDKQAEIFLDTIQSILALNPPSVNENLERGFARLLMDAVFHEENAALRKPSQKFFHSRVKKVIEELENTKVEDGARIWKLYNMGFIVRTKSVTLAFDFTTGINSGSREFAMGMDEINRIVKNCDALFITHKHSENCEKRIAETFIKNDLPVFAPFDAWKNDPLHNLIVHPNRIAHISEKLIINGKSIDMVTYPGHQMRGTECNVYVITTPEGITISHLGDQVNDGDYMVDFEWIDDVKNNYKIDIMMPNACTVNISRIVDGFNPKLVLPSHSLQHSNWTELPCWADKKYLELNYAELRASKYSVVEMLWGESFHYLPDKFNKKRSFLELSNWD